uniref:Uncharacterized protein n=1 Tax=Rangifer tarandus platyrhynchus TaxID=3082113 RepID=A0ACB0DZZ8_RANTA|nr:unnamed protein product [Rangifer tarandus platyrhynchus]
MPNELEQLERRGRGAQRVTPPPPMDPHARLPGAATWVEAETAGLGAASGSPVLARGRPLEARASQRARSLA